MIKKLIALSALVMLGACATTQVDPYDYTTYRTQDPHSILVVPVMNSSNEADAADFFLTTLPFALAERGYYVFPVNMVKRTMEADGLADASLVHEADPVKLGGLFNTDSILFVEIMKWESNYVVISSNITVSFRYTLKSAATGETLWQNEQEFVHSQSGNSGNFITDLIATAVAGAINSMKSDYTPLARTANSFALYTAGRGIPSGPYSALYNDPKDIEAFPKTGSGWIGGPKPDALQDADAATEAEVEPAAE
ncbi:MULTISPECIES: DUF799 domain-containing protein [Kordiimonas]|jgi:hypothetical protein|uniref:DUF799 domain-containing protein n=1 Tax=Kordiimonas TaxID=288021 RepID=UPI00257D9CD9|nr:GNA1162 family protein [Kordiimonas sp. UBA4487]